MVNFYPATILNLLMSFNSFLVVFIGFSLYMIISSANRENFTSYFPVWMLVISFSCLIALARTSSTMLDRSIDSRHPCVVPDLWAKAFSLSLLSMMLATSLSYMAFILLRYIPSIPTLSRVFSWKDIEFYQYYALSASVEMIIWFLSFIL